MPLLSYLFLVFVFFYTPNLKRSFNLFWRQVLGLESQVLGLVGQVFVNNTGMCCEQGFSNTGASQHHSLCLMLPNSIVASVLKRTERAVGIDTTVTKRKRWWMRSQSPSGVSGPFNYPQKTAKNARKTRTTDERRERRTKDTKDHKRRQRRIPDTCSQTATISDGNVEQRCSDCVSDAEHCQKVEPKKARTRSAGKAAVTRVYTIPSQLAVFRATTFSRTRHHVVLLRVLLSFSASLFLVSGIHTGLQVVGSCWNEWNFAYILVRNCCRWANSNIFVYICLVPLAPFAVFRVFRPSFGQLNGPGVKIKRWMDQ